MHHLVHQVIADQTQNLLVQPQFVAKLTTMRDEKLKGIGLSAVAGARHVFTELHGITTVHGTDQVAETVIL